METGVGVGVGDKRLNENYDKWNNFDDEEVDLEAKATRFDAGDGEITQADLHE
jgi:hypothetical protein